MLCLDWANTLCAGSCIFHPQTDTGANKHHSLLSYAAMYLVPPVSFYLKACYPSYFLFCTWPQNSSHLVCVSSIIDIRDTLVCLPEALGAFQTFFFLDKLFCFTHCGSKCLLTSFICLSWWDIMVSLWKSIVLSWELEVILSKHLVMTQAAYQIHITCDSLSWG